MRLYVRNLSSLYNYASNRGLCPKESPFKDVKLRPQKKADPTERKVLTLDDFHRLRSLDLTPYAKSLSLARDIFLFSVYAHGMRSINILFLRRSDIADGRLTYSVHAHKGNLEKKSITWNKPMQEIVDRYASSSPYLFPCITASDNEMAISQYRVVLRSINRSLKKLGKLLNLPFPLHMNVASYSWKIVMD